MARDYFDESKQKKKKKNQETVKKVTQSPSVTKNSTRTQQAQNQKSFGQPTQPKQQTIKRSNNNAAKASNQQRTQNTSQQSQRTVDRINQRYGTVNNARNNSRSRTSATQQEEDRRQMRRTARTATSARQNNRSVADRLRQDEIQREGRRRNLEVAKNTGRAAKKGVQDAVTGYGKTAMDVTEMTAQTNPYITKANLDKKDEKTVRDRIEKEAREKRLELQREQDKRQAEFDERTKNAKGLEKALYGAAESGAGMATDIGLGALTGTGQFGSLASMGLRTYGQTRGQAEKEGATANEDRLYSLLQSGKEVGTELMFPGAGLAKKAYGKAGLPLAEKATNVLIKGLTGKKADVASAGIRLLGGTAEENIEELAGWGLDPLIKEITYGKNVRKRYADTLRSNIPEVKSQEEAEKVASYFSTPQFTDELTKEYTASGMSEQEANELATEMRDYYVAYYSNDQETVESLEDDLSKKLSGQPGLSKESWSKDELLDTFAATTLLTMSTGLPGAVTTSVKGNQAFNDPDSLLRQKFGDDAVRLVANEVKNSSDPDIAAKADAMQKRLDSGKDLTGTQKYDLLQAYNQKIQDTTKKAQASEGTIETARRAQNLVPTMGVDENGNRVYAKETQRAYNEKYQSAATTAEAFRKYMESDNSISDDEIRRTDAAIKAVSDIHVGGLTVGDAHEFAYGNTLARETLKAEEGIDLDKYIVRDKNGNVDLAATNEATENALYTINAKNGIKMAQAETKVYIDDTRGEIDSDLMGRMGSNSQTVWKSINKNLDPRNINQYLTTARAVSFFDAAGRNTDMDMNEFIDQYSGGAFKNVNKTVLKRAFAAGRRDRIIANTPGYGHTVEAGAKIAMKDTTPIITGQLFMDDDIKASIPDSVQSAYMALAVSTNTNIYLKSDLSPLDKDGNPIINQRTGMPIQLNGMSKGADIYLNVNEAAEKNLGYVFMHEMTHQLKQYAPNEYLALENLVRDKWFNKDYAGMQKAIQDRIDLYKIKGGQTLTEEEALEEIIADAMAEAMDDPAFAAEVCGQDIKLGEQILNCIKSALRSIRDMFVNEDYQNEDFHNSLLSYLDILSEAEDMWINALHTARVNKANGLIADWENEAFKDTRLSVAPESERFNQKRNDIRYSITPESFEAANDNGIAALTDAEQEKIHAAVSPDIRFSMPTERDELPKARYKSDIGFSNVTKKISGRQARIDALKKNGFSKKQAEQIGNAISDFILGTGNWIEDDLQTEFTFIGWDDLINAEVSVRKDWKGKVIGVSVSAMVANGEYPVNFDLTTICNKREGIMQVIQELTRIKTDTGKSVLDSVKLTDEDMWKINTALKAAGIDTACLGCFVEARRYYTNRFIASIDAKWNAAVRDARKQLGLPEVEYFDFAHGKKVTGEDYTAISDLWTSYEKSKDEKKSPAQRIAILMNEIIKNKEVDSPYLKLVSASDILTPEGIQGLKQISTGKHDLVKTLKSIYGTSAPKEILAFTPYNSEIALLPTRLKGQKADAYLRSIGGIRVQSFSDFKIEHVIDHMQMVADMAARKFTCHAYSKVIAFPRIFGLTGQKINMSVMFDITPAEEWSELLGCSEEKAKEYAFKYAGLRFVKEKPAENPDNRPYIETEIEGVKGYLTYLLGDADYINSVFEAEKQKNIEAGMTEEEAIRAANEAKPFEQSINYREAVELENQDGYKENIGIIAVAYGDEHLKILLADPNVRYVIPYHKSGLPVFVSQKTSLQYARNYEPVQNTKKADPNEKLAERFEEFKAKHKDAQYPGIEFFKDIYENGSEIATTEATATEAAKLHGTGEFDVYKDLDKAKDIREVANAYLEDCIKNSLVPVFAEFSGDPNYYKMLFDFAVTDGTTTNIYPQKVVRNNYPGIDVDAKVQAGEEITNNDYAKLHEVIRKGAEEQNIKNQTRSENMESVLDEILAKDGENSILAGTNVNAIRNSSTDYTDPKGVHYSITPEMDDAYMDAVNSGNMEEAQRLVDEAAKEAGYNYRGFHGTNAEFTVFDPEKRGGKNFMATSAYKAFFAAGSFETAESYTGLNSLDWASISFSEEAIQNAENIKKKHKYAEAKAKNDKARSEFETRYKYDHNFKEQVDDNIETLRQAHPEYEGTGIFERLAVSFEADWNKEHLNDMWSAWENSEENASFKELNKRITDEIEQSEINRRGYKPHVLNLAIKLENPLIHDYNEEGRDFDEYTDSFSYYLDIAKENGNDGCIFLNVADGADFDTIYTVFDGSQFKSTDPVTYSEDGSVIPLSERFDPNNNDIRYSMPTTDSDGNILTDGQMEYFKNSQARDEQGRMVRVFHTTRMGGFTVFDPQRSDDHRSLFFTSNRRMSESYSKQDGAATKDFNPYEMGEVGITKTISNVYELPDFTDFDTEESVVRRISNIKIWDTNSGELYAEGDDFVIAAANIADTLKKRGYDDTSVLDDITRPESLASVGAAWEIYNNARELGIEYTMDFKDVIGTYTEYLNLENPLILDANGENWDSIPYGGNGKDVRNFTLYMEPEIEETDEYYGVTSGYTLEITWEELDDSGEWVNKSLNEHYASTDLSDPYWYPDKEIAETMKLNGLTYDIFNEMIKAADENPMDGSFEYESDDEEKTFTVYDTTYNTRQIAEFAQNEGYDGVIIKNVADYGDWGYGSEPGDVYIAFSSNQVKDTRNENPTENPDIRYSIPDKDEMLDYVNATAENIEDIPLRDPALEYNRARYSITVDEFQKRYIDKWNERELTFGFRLDEKSVEKHIIAMMKHVMAQSGTNRKYKADTLADTMNYAKIMWYEMKAYKTDAFAKTAWKAAEHIVNDIDYNDDLYVQYKGMREYLNKRKIQIPEGLEYDESFAEFIRDNEGRMRFATVSERGSSVNAVYKYLAKNYPELFPAEQEDPIDMLMQIDYALDYTTPYRAAYTSEEYADLVDSVATSLIDIVSQGEAYVSVADELTSKFDQRTKAMKVRHDEAIRKIKDEEKAKRDNTRKVWSGIAQNWKQKYYDRIQKDKQERKEKSEKKEHRKRFDHVLDDYNKLCKWVLEPTKEKNVPEEFRKALAEFLQTLDLQTENSKALEEKTGHVANKTFKLRELRDRLKDFAEKKDDEGVSLFEIDNSIDFLLGKLADKVEQKGNVVDAMDTQDIHTVEVFLKMLIRSIERYKQVKTETKMAELSDIGGRSVEFMLQKRKRDGLYGKRKGLFGAAGALETINATSLTPAYLFDRLGPIKEMYDVLRYNGFDTYIRNEQVIIDKLKGILSPYYNKPKGRHPRPGSEIESWRDDRSAQTIELANGQSVTMTAAQIMSLYCLTQRGEQALGHMLVGGILVTPIQTGSKIQAVKDRVSKKEETTQKQVLTPEDITNIILKLTPEQKKVADQLQELMSVDMAKLGNEAHRELYGYEMFNEPNYFPIKVHGNERATDINTIGDVVDKIKSFGFTKPLTPQANKAIEIDDIFSVVADHCNGMNLYNAYLVPITDFMKVLNYTHTAENGEVITMKEAIEQVYGKDMLQYILNLMKDINGIKAESRGGLEGIMNKALGTAKRTAVFGNIRVLLQQPTAVIRAIAQMNGKYLLPFVNVKPEKGVKEEMYKYCPIAQWKSWGYYDTYMGRDIEDVMMNNWSVSDVMLSGLYGEADNWTWSLIWRAVKAEQADLHPDMDTKSEEFLQMCGRRASEVFDKTQVVDSTFHRSDAMRNKQVAVKVFTAFMAEPTLTLNVFRAGLYNFKEELKAGNKEKAYKILAQALSAIILQAVFVSAAQAFADAWRGKDPGDLFGGDDDDDDKKGKWWENEGTLNKLEAYISAWQNNMMYNLFDQFHLENNMYLVKDVTPYINYMMSKWADYGNWNPVLRAIMGWDQEYLYSQNNLIFAGLENTANGIAQMFKKLEKGDEYDKEWYDIIQKTLGGIGTFTGFPVGTLMKDAKPILEGVVGITFASDELVTETSAKTESSSDIETESSVTDTEYSTKKPFFGLGKSEYEKHQEAEEKERQQAEKKRQDKIDSIKKKTESLSGETKDKKVWSYVTQYMKAENGDISLADHIHEGDYEYVDEVREMYIAAGGDTEYFDKRIFDKSKSEMKKTISADNTPEQIEQQQKIENYLLSHGMEEWELSEMAYKSYTAKDLKAAIMLNDADAAVTELRALLQAGMTDEDFYKLWENRRRFDIKSYKKNGKYKDRFKSTGVYKYPSNGTITSRFGPRSSPGGIGSTYHQGIDIGGSMGDPIEASDGGIVVMAKWYGGYGKTVQIQHDDGTITQYSHLSWWDCNEGDVVGQGQIIGKMGSTGNSTGPHLHFGVLKDGKYVDPINYLNK